MPNMQGPPSQHQDEDRTGEQPTGCEGTDDSKCRQPTQSLFLTRFSRLAAQGDSAYQLGRQMHNAFLRLARFGAIIS